MDVVVRLCTGGDIRLLEQRDADPLVLRRHRDRHAWQVEGLVWHFIAWDGERPVGHATLRRESKYEPVRMVLGTFPEINGLAADPPGRGVGRLLIAAAEETASSSGARLVGMAVAHTNTRARRLYERLGYEEWGHGQVIDDWDERDVDGAITVVHHDECAYLTKTVG